MSKEKVHVEFFYSPTCPYCPAAKKMLYEIAEQYAEILQIEEIDAWSKGGEPRAARYEVQLVPSIVINGEKRMEGIPNRKLISDTIAEAVARRD
ncbi:MAG: thioredoxin family protein [archaeon]